MAVSSCDALTGESLVNRPGELGQTVQVRHVQLKGMIIDEEEPVTAPGDVTSDSAKSVDLNCYLTRRPVADYIVKCDSARLVQYCFDLANRRLDFVLAGADSSQVSQRDQQTNRAVTAHAQVGRFVEENHARRARRVNWLAQQRSHYRTRPARLFDHGTAKPVVFGPQQIQAMRQRSTAQIRATLYNNPGGLATRM